MITRTVIKIVNSILPIFKVSSNKGYYIKNINTGELYEKVIVSVKHANNYIETDELIPVEEEKNSKETIK
jgi:hypothetical protein